ncbi:MAG: hypothetical protein RLZZ114_1004 [Bacteroidota bacterium]
MTLDVLLANLTSPALLFFLLGLFAVYVKSDLSIPENSSKFISLYLLFSIGFKGGQELSHEHFTWEIASSLLFAVALSAAIPVWVFYAVRKRLGVANASAVAASYGSVSAVTFVAAVAFLESLGHILPGHMVATMALMESPAIVVGLVLLGLSQKRAGNSTQPLQSPVKTLIHSLTHGSVLLILGSLVVGYFANAQAAEGIRPFTNDLFMGFLALFMLEMGLSSGRQLKAFFSYGAFPLVVALLVPFINGTLVAWLSGFITDDVSVRFAFACLAGSASHIAVPAAYKISVPEANPGLYLPMALAISFPLNLTLGLPYYWALVNY